MKLIRIGSALLTGLFAASFSFGQTNGIHFLKSVNGGPSVSLDANTGTYSIQYDAFHWNLAGRLGMAVNAQERSGVNSIGHYSEIGFTLGSGPWVTCTIRQYRESPVIWFRAHYDRTTEGKAVEFPYFNRLPDGLNSFSYQDRTFSPPTYGLATTATPYMLFDSSAHSLVLSPASNFMTTSLTGIASSEIGVKSDARTSLIPAGYDQDALLVFGYGINRTWDSWGSTMRTLFHRKPASADSDPTTKFFGYWTDNGADYYYNYDKSLGYAGTLVDLVKRYRGESIPLGYLQLDSWWYQKSIFDPAGHPGGAKKNNRLPIGSWNRYGGLMEYRAHPDLFPDGLAKFQQDIGLPLVVHNRWMDRTSPYHDHYEISGVATVDPAWWHDTADYLKRSGVVCYEQDWLDQIYINSPEMAAKPGVGDAFTGGMASGCRDDGLSMQYCMGTPRYFLQGLKYSNLTTIRTSGDRFEPRKWADFLYVSRLAHDVGILPWCDVFKSSETGNMILSVLSAGPVGTGDAIGRENRENIFKAVRADGVIVKPDQPLLPTDQTYLDGAANSKAPFVATTFTDHNGLRTRYLFAFPRTRGERTFRFRLRDLGVTGIAFIQNMTGGEGKFAGLDDEIEETIGAQGFTYLMIAPEMRKGLAFLGDTSKIVPTGKQRIASITADPKGYRFRVNFAPNESSVSLQFASQSLMAVHGAGAITRVPFSSLRYQFLVEPKRGTHTAEFVLDIP